jgi:phosphoglycolate phosphatase
MSAFEVVVFDYDGTLFDTRPAIVHCIERAFEECGRPIPALAGIMRTVEAGLPLQETMVVLDQNLRDDQAALDQLVETYRTLYRDEAPPLVKPFSGAGEALRILHNNGKQCVVVSNKGIAAIRRSLDQNQLSSFVDLVFGDQPGLPNKPDPAVLTDHILPRYPQCQRQQILMVGDTATDIGFAKAAGISSCWASYGYGELEDCRGLAPDHEISSIAELPALFLAGC